MKKLLEPTANKLSPDEMNALAERLTVSGLEQVIASLRKEVSELLRELYATRTCKDTWKNAALALEENSEYEQIVISAETEYCLQYAKTTEGELHAMFHQKADKEQ